MNKNILISIAIIVVAAGAFVFIMNSKNVRPVLNKEIPENNIPSVPESGSVSNPPMPETSSTSSLHPQAPAPAANPSQAAPSDVSVSIKNFKFSPSEFAVRKGTTVVWTNNDSAPHTITSDTGSVLSSKVLNQGDSYSMTFDNIGTFDYHCKIHPSMRGKITVTE